MNAFVSPSFRSCPSTVNLSNLSHNHVVGGGNAVQVSTLASCTLAGQNFARKELPIGPGCPAEIRTALVKLTGKNIAGKIKKSARNIN